VQRTRGALQREDQRGLGGFLGGRRRPPDQDEAGNVVVVVLDLLGGNLETEYLSGATGRHCAGIGALPFRDHLRAAGGVVHRDDLDAGHPGEALLALRERLWVRVHDREILEARSRPDQEAVVHRDLHFTDDRQLVLDEQIVVPMDASPDRVLHRQDPPGRASLGDRREHVFKAAARHHNGLRCKPQGRRFAVSAGFSLERNTHHASLMSTVAPPRLRYCRPASQPELLR